MPAQLISQHISNWYSNCHCHYQGKPTAVISDALLDLSGKHTHKKLLLQQWQAFSILYHHPMDSLLCSEVDALFVTLPATSHQTSIWVLPNVFSSSQHFYENTVHACLLKKKQRFEPTLRKIHCRQKSITTSCGFWIVTSKINLSWQRIGLFNSEFSSIIYNCYWLLIMVFQTHWWTSPCLIMSAWRDWETDRLQGNIAHW